jgi:hypothetical protein
MMIKSPLFSGYVSYNMSGENTNGKPNGDVIDEKLQQF